MKRALDAGMPAVAGALMAVLAVYGGVTAYTYEPASNPAEKPILVYGVR